MGILIALSGPHGAGKSTYARALASAFHLRSVSAGDLFRQRAAELGLSLLEMTEKAEEDDRIDRSIDELIMQEADKDNVILDGQLSAWLVKDRLNLSIYLTAPDKVRFQRIATRDTLTQEEAETTTRKREQAERERFLKLYGIDVTDLSIYHLVVDTNLKPLDEMITILKNIVRDYIEEKPKR